MSQRDRRRLQRGVIILPSAFTLGNLFFGVYAVVAALRGDFAWAGWFIVFAASLDLLDGRVARFTRTGSAFGAELDSLVDAVSFGMAPALIMILLYFSDAGWSWVLGFVYVTAVVVRLARFNVEQGGEAKRHFHGLPSPTAGMILATHYPFSQTAFFQANLSAMPWPQIMGVTMVLLSVLMLSHVPYAMVPRIDLRTRSGMTWTVLMALGIVLALSIPSYWFFPALVTYTVWGLLKSVFMGLLERLPERDPLLDTDEEEEETRQLNYDDLGPGPHSQDWKEHTS
ncbi:MAG: CDP-diacylglycerol--serine O-phosphatidyltransferase [Gemmatimonadetes bacterium]|nr:CDP-diacylglycerol--serine O-phosphatidyltransferase [Gemmatimonadota bacterium]